MKKPILLLIVILSAVQVNAQKVKVGVDPNVDFSKYKTYTWDKSVLSANPLIQQMIIEEVDKAASLKGLSKVEDNADMTFVALAAIDFDLHVDHPSSSNPTAPRTITSIGSSWPMSKGTLVLQMLDAHTKNSLWRATATTTLPDNPTFERAKDAKTVSKPLKKAVEKMFKQYPKPKGN
jgi:hypothetical protein